MGEQKKTAFVRSARTSPHGFDSITAYSPGIAADLRLYDSLREAIPVVDAAIALSVRLCGGFELIGENEKATAALKEFKDKVKVGAAGTGLETFLQSYLDGLLTYGSAVGEIVPTFDRDVCSLYVADVKDLQIKEKNGGTGVDIAVRDFGGLRSVRYQELLTFTALDPAPGHALGVSVLRGLPFVSGILLNVFDTLKKNWEKAGNIRYAVTYKPSGDPLDRAYAKERAQSIADEWGRAMSRRDGGDFVAVGDVNVSVIGAESPIPDSTVPVRQMLEQIIAKLGVPPFVLGLSWSSTERMSGEQADTFTSLLTSYRRTVTPALEKVGETYLKLAGIGGKARVIWGDINLRDELSEAQAAYYRARAAASAAGNTDNGDDIHE